MYKIVTSGKSKVVALAEISRNLKPSSEIYSISGGEAYLGVISHKTLVLFSVEFAEYALINYAKKKFPEAQTCIHLARKWLEDQESVSNDELRAAARDASYAATAADAASYAASYAATYAAANAAAYAAHAAADAAGKSKDRELLRQGTFIIDFLRTGKHLFLV